MDQNDIIFIRTSTSILSTNACFQAGSVGTFHLSELTHVFVLLDCMIVGDSCILVLVEVHIASNGQKSESTMFDATFCYPTSLTL